jgi:hypothetical protein
VPKIASRALDFYRSSTAVVSRTPGETLAYTCVWAKTSPTRRMCSGA